MKLSIYKKIITSAIFTLLFISSVNFCNLLPLNPNRIDSTSVVFDNPLLDSTPKNDSSPKNNKRGIVSRTVAGTVRGAKIGFKIGNFLGESIGTFVGIIIGAAGAYLIKPQDTTEGITTICIAGGGILGGIAGKKIGGVMIGVPWAIQLAPLGAIAGAFDILPKEKSSNEEKK